MVKKLRDAGAVIIGKTNLHELAYGITTISSMGGQTRNPYDPTRNPGGSSGGTGAAIAANFAAAGMGTDTCGSIRNPSAQQQPVRSARHARACRAATASSRCRTRRTSADRSRARSTDLAIMLDATVGLDPADPTTRASDGRIPRTLSDRRSATAACGDMRDRRS